jgi:hypothetical protein
VTTYYCRNGHELGSYVIWDAGAGRGEFCPTCRAPLSEYVHADPVRIWPVVAVVLVALLVVGAWWWWMWIAPH